MSHDFQELAFGGVLMAPAVAYAALALIILLLLRPLLQAVRFASWFQPSPVAELSLYVLIFGFMGTGERLFGNVR